MILDYHRAKDAESALNLLQREGPQTLAMGGGSVLNAPQKARFEVVDLQSSGLNTLRAAGSRLDVGAAVTLETLRTAEGLPLALETAIRHEASRNLRQVGTVAGTLVAATGRSAFAIAMLALDTRLIVQPQGSVGLGNLLHQRTLNDEMYCIPGQLITSMSIPLNVDLEYHYVARTPADLPIVALAAARWPSGRLRVVVGGWDTAPRLALDATDPQGMAPAVANALSDSGDVWASAAYRAEAGGQLASRAGRALSLEGFSTK